jgi:hypothetical protein
MESTDQGSTRHKAESKPAERRAPVHAEPLGVEADILLPSQFYALRGGRSLSGEQRLMLAILADAINIFQGCQATGEVPRGRLFREAEEWIFSSDERWPFSFVTVCDALGIEPQALRRHLRSLEREIRAGTRSADSFRLRLKESNRAQHMTVNRERAHRRRAHSLAN